jgi:hypothetical protein
MPLSLFDGKKLRSMGKSKRCQQTAPWKIVDKDYMEGSGF